jgi:hypothetical protein
MQQRYRTLAAGMYLVLMHRSVQLYSYSALPVLHVARVYMHSYVRQ